MERDEFYAKVIDFLRALHRELGEEAPDREVSESDNLFDIGMVNSFQMIRLIVFLEELSGNPIDLEEGELDRFYTLEGLYQVAVVGAGEPA